LGTKTGILNVDTMTRKQYHERLTEHQLVPKLSLSDL